MNKYGQRRGQTGEDLAARLAPLSTLTTIITRHDAEAIDLLNETANQIGKELSKNITTSQIRNVFGAVRMIEQDTKGLDPEARLPASVHRALVMLRPKLAYQYGRISGNPDDPKKAAMGAMTTILSNAIGLVGDSQSNFRNFVDFFEAILAYHRYHG